MSIAAVPDARAGRPWSPVAAVLLGPVSPRAWLATAYVLLDLPVGVVAFALVGALLGTAASLTPLALVGVPLLWLGLVAAAVLARVERHRIRLLLDVDVPARPWPGAGLSPVRRFLAWLTSLGAWKQVLYCLLLLPLGAVGFTVVLVAWSAGLVFAFLPLYARALPADGHRLFGLSNDGTLLAALTVGGIALLFTAPWLARGWAALDAVLVRALLGPSERELLAARVTSLTETRARVVDAADAERRRIERDLHDGAQQRLVALAMNLGRARAKLEDERGDAESLAAARALVGEAHDEAKEALAELRDLVRGIHPAVLTDRGLDAALSALAARSPVPVGVSVDSGGRCSPTTEAVAYVVVAEALSNVAKHARASRAEVDVRRAGPLLVVSVTDDGVGGALVGAPSGSGLSGLRDGSARSTAASSSPARPAGPPASSWSCRARRDRRGLRPAARGPHPPAR